MINLFVVSRFASTTNRRINHLLDLTGEGARTHVVRQRHGKAERQIQHSDTVDVDLRARGFYPLNVAMALIASLELGMLGSFPLSISVYLGALKRGLFAALRQAARELLPGGEARVMVQGPGELRLALMWRGRDATADSPVCAGASLSNYCCPADVTAGMRCFNVLLR